ncbi:non-ribosomal peptide synthetase [Rosenbergiella nectarea]|uniref:non-ribosomal peptide synthetase n=1 Tax=Rosenbergiella nectarea TaxID=988801 RepID=UPI001BDAA09C|nr:non-ribosomal peptide synthetase [Rosenbergiella nectarea]MBT0728725.1 non-ribosomal peptide synthetase [Rosenbergiella nectarea subsp. apis]
MFSERYLHTEFENQCVRTPESIAVISDDGNLTYSELDYRATQLALYLIKLGVRKGSHVGLYLPKCPEMIISMLAILKAGASYVPLDPSYPIERLIFMINHSQARIVLTGKHLANTLDNANCQMVYPHTLPWTQMPGTGQLPYLTKHDPCYVLYTSGSTGQPKGVVVSHHSVVDYLDWMESAFKLMPEDVVLNQSAISFDVSVWEIFWPLSRGAACALISDEKRFDPRRLADFIIKHNVTVAQFVPTALRVITAKNVFSECHSLRYLFSGGEALDQRLVDELLTQFNGALYNLYGPTEATIFTFFWNCQAGQPISMVPIGHPIPQAYAYILDKNYVPVAKGQIGELYLGGTVLAQGYLHNPSLTEKVFIEDPFSQKPDAKMYKTGDLVRQNGDGVTEFIGRVDSQLKIRGHRVESGEIETQLRTHPDIEQAFVIPVSDPTPKIEAFYLLRPNKEITASILRDYLSQYLPFYMIPSNFYQLKSIPILPNGKADLKILRNHLCELGEPVNNLSTPKQNVIDKKLLDIWKMFLNVEKLSLGQNFFDAGGNSLLMSRVHREIKKELNIPISIMELFQYPTVTALSDHLVKKYSGKIKFNQ